MYQVEVTASSKNYAYSKVSITRRNQNDRVTKVRVLETLSKTKGEQGKNFGILDDGSGIWVHKGFRAKFYVDVEPSISISEIFSRVGTHNGERKVVALLSDGKLKGNEDTLFEIDEDTWLITDEKDEQTPPNSALLRKFADGRVRSVCVTFDAYQDVFDCKQQLEAIIKRKRAQACQASAINIQDCLKTNVKAYAASIDASSSSVAENERTPDPAIEANKRAYAAYVLRESSKSAAPKLRGTVAAAIFHPSIRQSFNEDEKLFKQMDPFKMMDKAISLNALHIQSRNRDSDFALAAIVRSYLLNLQGVAMENGPYRIPEDLCAKIEAAFRSFRYWVDDPGQGDRLVFWTENHAALFLSSEWLVGRLLSKTMFVPSKLTGQDHAKKAAARLNRWLDYRLDYGFGEFNSPVYYPFSLAPLLNLVDFADHPALASDPLASTIKKKAVVVCDILMEEFIYTCHRGAFRGAAGRTYDKFRKGCSRQDIDQLSRILSPESCKGCSDGWGFTLSDSVSASFFCTTTYNLPRELLAVLRNKHRNTFEFRWRCGVPLSVLKKLDDDDAWMIWGAGAYGEPDLLPLTVRYGAKYDLGNALGGKSGKGGKLISTALNFGSYVPDTILSGVSSMASSLTSGSCLCDICVYNFSTPAVQVSAALHYNQGMKSFQQLPWCAVVDQQSCVWTSADSLPRVHAHGGLVVAIYKPDYTVCKLPASKEQSTAWIPLAQFDSWALVEDQSKTTWIIGRKKLCGIGQACCSREGECPSYMEPFNQEPDCGTCPETETEGFIAICSAIPLELPTPDEELKKVPLTKETTFQNEWVAKGWNNIWVCRVGWSGQAAAATEIEGTVNSDLSRYENYEAFEETIKSCATRFSGISNHDKLKVCMQDSRLKNVEAGWEGEMKIGDEAVNQKIDFSFPQKAQSFC